MIFEKQKLIKVCLKIGSGATPRGGKDAYHESGEYSLVRSQNILDFTFSKDGLAFINEDQASKLDNVALEERDILLNITGDSVARVCQIPKEILPARVNQHVAIIRPNPNILNPEFLKYYLLNPKFKEYMLMLSSSGATRNAITKGMIEEFEIDAPDLSTQKAIAQILSSLDDKIELNNQINQNLEALAQALFKQWFVDFEFPNENGDPYKSSGGDLVDSELGEIPKEWKVSSIGEITKVVTKGTTPTTLGGKFTEEGINFIKVESISESGSFLKSKFAFIDDYTHELQKRSQVQQGDVLFSIAGTIGRVAIATNSILPANTNQAIAIIRPDKVDSNFLRLLMKSSLIQSDTKSNVVQAVQANLSLGVIKDTKFILPNNKTLVEFKQVSKSLIEMVEELTKEIEDLIQLRDTLLPKLISGELEVYESLLEQTF
jgi:type I restriction enzyme S subunit